METVFAYFNKTKKGFFFFFSSRSATAVHTEIFQQCLDGLAQNFGQTLMAPIFIQTSLVIPWTFHLAPP